MICTLKAGHEGVGLSSWKQIIERDLLAIIIATVFGHNSYHKNSATQALQSIG